MSESGKGPQGRRRGTGARERILGAAQQLFRAQGINNTGMDQLSAVAQVSKRTVYQHFGSKDKLVAEYLQRLDPDTMPEVFERTDLTTARASARGVSIVAGFDARSGATVPVHRCCRGDRRPGASRARTSPRVQGSRHRSAHRRRPRGGRLRSGTAWGAVGAAARRRLGANPDSRL